MLIKSISFPVNKNVNTDVLHVPASGLTSPLQATVVFFFRTFRIIFDVDSLHKTNVFESWIECYVNILQQKLQIYYDIFVNYQ